MDFYDLIDEVGCAAEEIAIFRTVLDQAMQFFDSNKKENIDLIPYYAGTIQRLLTAADTLLFTLCGNMQNCHDRALKRYQEEQYGKTN